jgi:putative FmdB family regulatory protein
MPIYTYRREDGSTFDIRQSFNDEPLTVDPETGQKVVRTIHAAGVIFKGSGFYVNDSKSASNSTMSKAKSGSDSETKSEAKSETNKESAEPKKESETKKTENKAPVTAAAD